MDTGVPLFFFQIPVLALRDHTLRDHNACKSLFKTIIDLVLKAQYVYQNEVLLDLEVSVLHYQNLEFEISKAYFKKVML